MLARVGVKAAEVPLTLVSHLHWDHWGGYELFPGQHLLDTARGARVLDGYCRAARELPPPSPSPSPLPSSCASTPAAESSSSPARPRCYRGSSSTGWAGTPRGSRGVRAHGARSGGAASVASHFYPNIQRRDPVQIITTSRRCPRASRTSTRWPVEGARGGGPRPRGGHALRSGRAGDHQNRVAALRRSR